ncbi:site-2 protease family protein [Pseudemcibacter aquimaris]|uniref:site-2 protease family protein n=1 Tax=Pseudemcibacter aquimaris TaxID=2857064 RepID=UPI002012DCC7|nr:site-2 protease family protein [Pseudemcibacter aquimaris]MCC3860532.1 site-2 protease family protein [Pseudemcibacter aquimaris]WDU59357.1 site-2 protease family protein [Pseudemcibacter aquimaris]
MSEIMVNISVWALPLLFAITLHEAAHAWTAWKLGDNTAKMLGRVTFNPISHIDPFGTVILPLILLLSGSGFMFGYAKPVPVQFNRLNNPRRDSVLVALAGPGANIFLLVMSAIFLNFIEYVPGIANEWVGQNLVNMIIINAILAVFNMLPIPPLDGGRVAVGVLPYPLSRPLARLEPYGMLIIIMALFIIPVGGRYLGLNINIFQYIVMPPVQIMLEWAQGLANLF